MLYMIWHISWYTWWIGLIRSHVHDISRSPLVVMDDHDLAKALVTTGDPPFFRTPHIITMNSWGIVRPAIIVICRDHKNPMIFNNLTYTELWWIMIIQERRTPINQPVWNDRGFFLNTSQVWPLTYSGHFLLSHVLILCVVAVLHDSPCCHVACQIRVKSGFQHVSIHITWACCRMEVSPCDETR